MTVWVLVFYISGFQAGGPAVIDNIATKAECQRVYDLIPMSSQNRMRCIEVRKVK